MKKKIIYVVLLMVFAMSFVACGNKGKDGNNGKEEDRGKTITADELLSVYDFKIEDNVTLGDYKNIDVTLENDYSVMEEDIISYLNSYMENNKNYSVSDKQDVEDGDIVNIDYVGKIDGKEFEGGTDTGSHLEIGSNSFITGFESGLIGHKVGEDISLNLKFPDDYWNEEYKGKDVVFDVKINSIETAEPVTYETVTDEYVKETYGYDNKQAWYDSTKETLESSMEQQKTSDLQDAIIKKLLDTSTVKIPESLLKKEIDDTVKQAEAYAKETLGTTMDEYLQQYEGVDTVDEYKDKIKEEVENSLKEKLLLDAIIKDKDSTITTGGYTDFLSYYLDSYGMNEEEFYKRYGEKEEMMLVYAENIVLSELVDSVQNK